MFLFLLPFLAHNSAVDSSGRKFSFSALAFVFTFDSMGTSRPYCWKNSDFLLEDSVNFVFSLLAGTFLALLEAFSFTPEHTVVKYEIPMIARVHSFLDESVSYYEDKGPLFYGKELGYEYYGSGGNDPISDGNSSPISWYFYDLDGNLLDHGGSF